MTRKNFSVVFAVMLTLSAYSSAQAQDKKTGLIKNNKDAFEGYTLLAPIGSKTTYLIDMTGRVVNKWESDYQPGQSAYLLENGHLLRTASLGPQNRTFHGGGAGGRVQEFTWDGELVWDFEYASDTHLSHHDIERLPNGNVLMIAWELKNPEEAVAAGRDPELVAEDGLWADHIIEVKPTGKTTGKIVWEWHLWDHLVQDIDPRKANFGDVADHPELVNINPIDWFAGLSQTERQKLESLGYLDSAARRHPKRANPDWNHTNSIAYNAQLDQIALSVLGFNEIWIIDHSTNSKHTAGHTGGKSGKGGDLLYRWGNPRAYGAGTAADQHLFAQHDVQWIQHGLRGAGNLLVFNNGRGRPDGNYSSVDEIVPPVDNNGRYMHKAKTAFGPAKPQWSYTASHKTDFYSGHVSGAQRLANGNTLICAGESGTIFEVTPKKQVVWKYINPVVVQNRPPRNDFKPDRGERPPRNRPDRDRPLTGDPPMRGPGRVSMPGVRGADKGGPGRRGPGMRRPGRGAPGMPGPPMHGPQNTVFKACRYAPEYPGLDSKKLTSGKSIEELVAEK